MSDKNKSALGVLKPYLLRYRKLWIAGIFAVASTNIFMLAGPWILRLAINDLEKDVTARRLAAYAAAIVLVTLISAAFRFMMRQTMIVASRKVEYDFRNDFFAHILTLDRQYYDKTPTGDIMARASNDMDSVRAMIGPGIMYFCSTAVALVLAISLMVKISLNLTLLALIPMPVITVLVFFLGREVNKRYAKIQKQYSDITARAQESFSGVRVVKAYVREDYEIEDFGSLSMEYVRKNMSMVRVWGFFFPAIVLFSGVALIMVLWFGGKAVIEGTINLGDFVAFSAYLLLLIWPMAALGWVVGLYQRGKASLGRINQILDEKPAVANTAGAINREIEGKIEFRNLRFGYGRDVVLNDINIFIEPGTRVALIGDTGSGKTTLVSLLMRAYPVERGMIFIDDIDINDYDLKCLRSQIVPVMQETFLFSDTIKQNIAYGRPDVEMESVRQFALTAGIAAEIDEFPGEYETILGERGITLSGGQKQRTALARALSSDPRILILDDAFSSVDTRTEEEILTNLRQILSGRTTITISHRISTVKDSDIILVLKDGVVVEKGRHAELITAGGHYARLYERQLLEDELETL
ncbi:MAG: ABC transporter ATP-binding protein [Candidatus Zixiibacteriota bacterium]|nr:MAG: ABC transporter ATP-binding protein [candidate division Zixibacteria bacterium]